MSLLDKFDAVQIQSDSRISEDDKVFCEAHQAAYENAMSMLKELKFCWESMLESQRTHLDPIGETRPHLYLTDCSNLSLSEREIDKQLQKIHGVLIDKIIDRFRSVYSISLSSHQVKKALLPEEPTGRWNDDYHEKMEKYQAQMQEYSLHYNQIIDQIFIQTDSRGLWEFAVHQLKQRSHEGAWSYGSPNYERKKQVIRFSYAVYGDRSLRTGAQDILRGLAHFETGKLGIIPSDFTYLFGRTLPRETFEFENCEKVRKLRAFLNGKMEIRFSDEAYAVKFIEEYLGAMPE